jgi:hypothetical protein
MPTEAQKNAQKRYYAKVRETRLVQMRERARERATEVREMMDDPIVAEEVRLERIERYHRSVTNKKKKKVEEWLEDPGISEVFKSFLRQGVLPVIETLPKKFLDICWDYCAIVRPNPPEIFPAEVDGRTTPHPSRFL